MIFLSIYAVRWRHDKRFGPHGKLENAKEGAPAVFASAEQGGNDNPFGPASPTMEVVYSHQDRHYDSPYLSADNDDDEARSEYSDTSSQGTFGQRSTSVAETDEYAPSFYPTSTLPEYTERSRSLSLPGYTDLSRSQTRETRIDVARGNLVNEMG
jgi:hypothetical protein